MITFRRMNQLSIVEIVELWNRSFTGYLIPVQMTESLLLARLGKLKISTRHSVVAYKENRAVGFVAQAIESMAGKRIAWNGGTGVVPEERGTGVGAALVAEALRVLKTESVDMATLEAIETNTPAIRLYEKMGYHIVSPLYFYALSKESVHAPASSTPTHRYRHTVAQAMETIPFVPAVTPWQNHPDVMTQPEVWLGYQGDEARGYILYILFERRKNAEGKHQLMVFQLAVRSDAYAVELIEQWIQAHPADQYQTFNLVASPTLCQALERVGFEKQRGQVWMHK
jgi:GNAT superfamily N-acetyltransferase